MKPKSTPDPASLRERALAYLARREHSRFELTRKLEAVGYSASDIHPVLDELETKNWLSDRRFAESWVADHKARSGFVKLTHDLRQRGIGEHLIEDVLNNSEDNEADRAKLVWLKKFASPATDATTRAKQVRFMQSRGFTNAVIWKIISPPSDEEYGQARDD